MAGVIGEYRKEYKPDLVIANGENLAHGSGITMDTIGEVFNNGVDFLTGGNDTFSKKGVDEIFLAYENKMIRPANYPEGVPGRGYATLKVNGKRVVVINLAGRVFMKENLDDPFRKFDEIKKLLKIAKSDIVVVDFHGEATSEKSAFGWYTDGTASAVLGTHTHVGTVDASILPQGTAFISDVGMVGAVDSIIGTEKTGPLEIFLKQTPAKFEVPEEGRVKMNAVVVEVDEKTGKAKSIKRADREITI